LSISTLALILYYITRKYIALNKFKSHFASFTTTKSSSYLGTYIFIFTDNPTLIRVGSGRPSTSLQRVSTQTIIVAERRRIDMFKGRPDWDGSTQVVVAQIQMPHKLRRG